MPSSPEPARGVPAWRAALAVAVAAVCLAATPARGARLVVPAEATVERDPVRVGDVAALDGAAAEALAGVVLGPAPQAGESRTIDGARVLERLHQAGMASDVTYTIPPLLRVRRAAQEVRVDAVRPLVEEFLRHQLGDGAEPVDLRAVELPGLVVIPTGPWSGRITLPPGTPLVGRVRLALEILQDDRPVRTVWITAELARLQDVVVVTRAIGRGELIAAADVTVQRLEVASLPKSVLTDPASLEGAVARTSLLPWTPVRRDQVGTATVVRRGEIVLLVAQRGVLRITAAGEARHDAGRGETISVINKSSGKQLTGRVVDASTVAVEF